MKNNKSIEILRTFSEDHLKNFKLFIASPYYNTNKKLVKLYDLIYKARPVFNDDFLIKENLFKKLYPGKTYNQQVIKNLFTQFNDLIEEFITLTEFKKNPIDVKYYRLKFFQSNHKEEFEKYAKLALRDLEKNIFNTQDKIKNRLKIYELYSGFYYRTSLHNKVLDYEILMAIENAKYSLIKIIEHAYIITNYSLFYDTKLNNDFFKTIVNGINFEKIFSELHKLNLNDKDLIYMNVIYRGYLLFSDKKSEAVFEEMKKLIYDNHKLFDEPDLKTFWDILNVTWFVGLNKNDTESLRVLLEFDKFFLSIIEFPLKNEKYINYSEFISIFSHAKKLEDWDWAKQFIAKYSKFLEEETRSNTENFVMGQCLMGENNFKEAISHFIKIDLNEVIRSVDVKIFLMQCYYELGYYEQIYSAIDAINHYLKENSDARLYMKRKKLKPFIAYLKELVKTKTTNIKLDYVFQKQFENEPRFMERGWIERKIKELK